VQAHINGTPQFDNNLTGLSISKEYFDIIQKGMITIVKDILREGEIISTLVLQRQVEQSCYQQACKEPYNDNLQQLHFVQHFIQNVE